MQTFEKVEVLSITFFFSIKKLGPTSAVGIPRLNYRHVRNRSPPLDDRQASMFTLATSGCWRSLVDLLPFISFTTLLNHGCKYPLVSCSTSASLYFFSSKSLIPPSIYVDTCEPGRQCREGTGLYRGLGPGAESGQMG